MSSITITLTDVDTGEQLVQYPAHHEPTARTCVELAERGIAVTIIEQE